MSAYRNRILATNPTHLIGCWTLGENAGVTAGDLSGHDHDGTLSGARWGAAGMGDGNRAARFDGVNAYVNLYSTGLASAFSGNAGTLVAWLKADDWADGVGRGVLAFRCGNDYLVQLEKTTSGELHLRYKTGTIVQSVYISDLVNETWYHVVMSWDQAADAVKVYLDGVQTGGTQTGLGTWTGTPNTLLIGALSAAPTSVWAGTLAHVALWDVALSADEISGLAMQCRAPTQWAVDVDWDNDGAFVSDGDDITDRVISARWFLGARKPYQDIADDTMLTLVLDNSDQRFSPENTGGPLAGKLAPFRLIRLQSNDGYNNRTHWAGWIESIKPSVNMYGKRQVEITAAGPMQFYKAAETALELQENLRTNQVIEALLQEIVIPPALGGSWVLGRTGYSELGQTTYLAVTTAFADLDTGATMLAVAADNWVRRGGSTDQEKDTFDVYRAIRDVVAAERGRFLFNREGKGLFWNRHHLMAYSAVPGENMLTNGDFSNSSDPTERWQTSGATLSVSGGVAQAVRTGAPGTLYQVMPDSDIPAGATLTISLDLGNSGAQNKTVQVRVHEGDYTSSEGESFSQTYMIYAGAPLTTYTFSPTLTTRWSQFTLEVSLTDVTGDPALLVDDVVVEWLALDDVMTDLTYQYAGLDDFKNEIVVVCHPRTISDTDQDLLWQLEEPFKVPKGETRKLTAKYQDDSENRIGAKEVSVTGVSFKERPAEPTSEKDINTRDKKYQFDGDGAGEDGAIIVLDAGANSAELAITNRSGERAAVLTSCELRGRKITDFGQMEATQSDPASIRDYGRRTLRLNLPSVDNFDAADLIAQFELHRRSQPRGAIGSITLVSHGIDGGDQHTPQLAWTLGDKVTIQEGQTTHQGAYCIVGEEHKLSASATLFETTWYLEPAPDVYPWKVGVAGRSELGQTTTLVY